MNYPYVVKATKEELFETMLKMDKEIERLKESEEYFKDCINDLRSIYESLCFSAPEMTPVFLGQMKEIFDDIEENVGADE